ncbi:MAG TPA: DUF6174 domain-containing protein [Gemmatimonadota bacterium]|nr:DUF6174 domain-containing protein [Gemmatimonadota bacterium]
MTRALVLAAVLALASCDLLGSDAGRQEALQEARRRWAAQGSADYTLTVRRSCFCGQEAIGPALLRVAGGDVVSRIYTETGDPVPEAWARLFPDVEGLFDVVEDAIERNADRIDVTYDPRFGYPSEVFIDYEERVADEELGLTVLGFTPGS